MGDLEFGEDGQGQATLQDGPENESTLQVISTLLNLRDESNETESGGHDSLSSLRAALLNPVLRAGKECVSQARDARQARAAVEALCRALYERLFGHLLDRLNSILSHAAPNPSTVVKQKLSPSLSHPSAGLFIGVLDIAGFEVFGENNSFAQLCINHCNERLQQFFNHHMFIAEQAEYAAEGIPWQHLDYGQDLQPTIDLIEMSATVKNAAQGGGDSGFMGILACLDEECLVPKATDVTFTDKLSRSLHSSYLLANSRQAANLFTQPRFKANTGFTLKHYAGPVEYTTAGWLEKNKDPLSTSLIDFILQESRQDFLQSLLFLPVNNSNRKDGNGSGSMFRTVGQKHRESLQALLQTLHATTPHFVRCILPNDAKQAGGKLQPALVLQQLKCNGVLEGIRISRTGFPHRLGFYDVLRLYSILATSHENDKINPLGAQRKSASTAPLPGTPAEIKARVKNLLDHLSLSPDDDQRRDNSHTGSCTGKGLIGRDAFAVGKTRVFFKAGALAILDAQRDRLLADVIGLLQGQCRMALAKAAQTKTARAILAFEPVRKQAAEYLRLKRLLWWQLLCKVKPLLSVTRTQNRIAQLEGELQATHNTLLAKDALLNDHVQTIYGKDELLRECERDIARLSLDLQETTRAKEEAWHARDHLLSQLRDTKEQLDEVSSQLSIKTDRLTGLEGKLQESILEREALVAQMNLSKAKELDEMNQLLTAKLASHTEALRKIEADKNAQISLLQEQSEQALALMRADQQRHLEALQSDHAQIVQDLHQQEQETKRRLTRDLSAKQAEIEAHVFQLQRLQSQLCESLNGQKEEERWKQERTALEQQIKDLKRFHADALAREEQLRLSEVNSARASAEKYRLQLDEALDALTTAQTTNEHLTSQLRLLKHDLDALKESSSSKEAQAKEALGQVRSQAIQAQCTADDLREQLVVQEALRSLAESEAKDARARLSSLISAKVHQRAHAINFIFQCCTDFRFIFCIFFVLCRRKNSRKTWPRPNCS